MKKILSLESKAKTLILFKPYLSSAKILSIISLTVREYSSNKIALVSQIVQKFQSDLIVRTSSKNEDNEKTSNAGGFDSMMNVDSNDTIALQKSIDNMHMTSFLQMILENKYFLTPIYIKNEWMEVDEPSDLNFYLFV